jgi:hypothetical protein
MKLSLLFLLVLSGCTSNNTSSLNSEKIKVQNLLDRVTEHILEANNLEILHHIDNHESDYMTFYQEKFILGTQPQEMWHEMINITYSSNQPSSEQTDYDFLGYYNNYEYKAFGEGYNGNNTYFRKPFNFFQASYKQEYSQNLFDKILPYLDSTTLFDITFFNENAMEAYNTVKATAENGLTKDTKIRISFQLFPNDYQESFVLYPDFGVSYA